MEKITMKKLNDNLHWDTYAWGKNTNKKLIGTIEKHQKIYKVKAYFRGKYYGYDVYAVDEEDRTTYILGIELHTKIKTKKQIIRAIYNFFNREEE